MEVLELTGSGRSLGQAHGEALRDKIRDFSERALDIHALNIGFKITRQDLLDFTRRNLAALRRYSPELFEEMAGVAQGAGLEFDEILFLNSFLELEDLRPPALGGQLLAKPLWGCTSFNILPEATREGKTFLAQTYDMEPFYARYNVILKINRPQGREIVYTLAGVLGLNGLNDRGLGVVINKLVAKDARPGVIYPFIIRQALAQDRLGDAFGAIVFASRATGMNYQLASKDGLGFCLELSAGQYCLLPFEGSIAHTNHYLSSFMRVFETPNWLSHGGSYVRREVARRFLRENHGKIDVAAIQAITRDHTNYPRCVCAHYVEGEKETSACATIAAVILDLRDGVMLACPGNPCQSEYQKISF
ncbi:MAG: C45 family peptidase [Deltaproteobacteria bacterium]|jgi:isopenicillin-N N-acyltransferase-like protein|nr:C45 family peptidase [Deltaproteobacteria bacterium]